MPNVLVGNLIQDDGGQMGFEYVESWLNEPTEPTASRRHKTVARYVDTDGAGRWNGSLPGCRTTADWLRDGIPHRELPRFVQLACLHIMLRHL
jgi:hypothetical protein